MSKAILVMDMPESCDMCDFVDNQGTTAYGVDKMYCNYPGIGEEVSEYIACRPDFCPMHTMPENMECPPMNGANYEAGWNACIDAITGNTRNE